MIKFIPGQFVRGICWPSSEGKQVIAKVYYDNGESEECQVELSRDGKIWTWMRREDAIVLSDSEIMEYFLENNITDYY